MTTNAIKTLTNQFLEDLIDRDVFIQSLDDLMSNTYNEGYNEGYDEGHNDGYDAAIRDHE